MLLSFLQCGVGHEDILGWWLIHGMASVTCCQGGSIGGHKFDARYCDPGNISLAVLCQSLCLVARVFFDRLGWGIMPLNNRSSF